MNLNQLNKKMLTLIVAVVVIFISVIIIISFVNRNRNLSFEAIETKMRNGAIKYLKQNEELLPKENGERIVVSVVDLENGKYIPMMSVMVKGETICNGEVRVMKNNNEYLYMPYLNCGNKHVTIELAKKLKEDVVSSDSGLYEMNGEFVYRGEKVNNYVLFNDRKWRILKIDNENNIKIFDALYRDERTVWDNRYNPDRGQADGYNEFEKSRIYERLKTMFNDEKYLSSSSKSLIISKDLCIGKRDVTDTKNDGSIECSETLANEPLGLMQLNEYLIVSLEPGCKKSSDRVCQNYNYLLEDGRHWFSITPYSKDSYSVFRIAGGGTNITRASNESLIRPTLYLTSNVIYKSGTGTFDDPYIIK